MLGFMSRCELPYLLGACGREEAARTGKCVELCYKFVILFPCRIDLPSRRGPLMLQVLI